MANQVDSPKNPGFYGGLVAKAAPLAWGMALCALVTLVALTIQALEETLATIGYKELKKAGVFLLPGFAKFVVIKKPATKARAGTNPFTGDPMMFKAKPARKIVRARPVKAAKDAV